MTMNKRTKVIFVTGEKVLLVQTKILCITFSYKMSFEIINNIIKINFDSKNPNTTNNKFSRR